MAGSSAAARGFVAGPGIPGVRAHSLRQNAIWMGSGQLLTWTLTAATLALLPRYFGAENLGRIGVAVAFSQLAMTVASMGMATLITREIARDRESARTLLATALWLHLVLGTLGGLAAFSAGVALGYEPLTVAAIAVLATTVPLDLVSLLAFATLQGLEVMRFHALWDVAGKLLHLAGLCLVVALDLGLPGYLVMSFVAALIPSVGAFRLMRRFAPFSLLGFSIRQAVWMVRQAVPIGAVNVVLIVYLAVDVIMLSRLAGEGAAGVYAAPMRVFGTLLFAPTIIATVLFPRLSAHAARDRAAFARLCDGAIRVVLGVTVVAAIGAATVGRELVDDVFGADFARSGPVLAMMALALVPTSINMIAHRILVALDRQAVWTWVMLAALAFKVGLDLALIPLFDLAFANPALGAAAALALAELAMMAIALRALPRGVAGRPLALHSGRLAVAAAAVVAVALATAGLGLLLSAAATAATIPVAMLITGAYHPAELVRAVRHMRGVHVMESAAAHFAVDTAALPPILFEPGRLKANRPAGPRLLHIATPSAAAPPTLKVVRGSR